MLEFTKLLFFIFLVLISTGCNGVNPPTSNASPISHELWDKLLKKHVNEKGLVDYQGFKRDKTELEKYLELLGKSAPNDESWTKEEQLAYWINAYNAFTIQLVLENYPVESIKDIGSGPLITFINSPWDIKFIKIGEDKYDLNNIEHGIIRKNFNEPRIHFALVCAAKSCPELRGEAYTGELLNQQLEEETFAFINNPTRNEIGREKALLSKYFTWYAGDFKDEGKGVIDFINQYAEVKISQTADIAYLDYDWSLNEQ